MDLNFVEIQSVDELFKFNSDSIIGLTTFIVGGCDDGTVFNILFETGKDRYCYQTLGYDDYVVAQKFINAWLYKRIGLIISAIDVDDVDDVVFVGDYRISHEGVFINEKFFRWEDSIVIFDGIQTLIKSDSSGVIHSIDNLRDFLGYLVVCFLHNFPIDEIVNAKSRWMGRDLIAEENNRFLSELHVQNLEMDYLESIFKEFLSSEINKPGIVNSDYLNREGNLLCQRDWGVNQSSGEDVADCDDIKYFSEFDDGEFDSSGIELLDSFGIEYLYHITHYSNLQGILRNGLLAHDNRFVVKNIDNASVNEIRSRAEPVYNKSIHSYVPFYFNPKNPMLYVNKERQSDVLVLAFDRKLLVKKGVVFTDGNAAKGQTRFFNDLYDLDKLNWDCLRADYWHEYENGKSHRMAEVLVWNEVGIEALNKIFCYDAKTREYVLSKNANLDVEVNKSFYF